MAENNDVAGCRCRRDLIRHCSQSISSFWLVLYRDPGPLIHSGREALGMFGFKVWSSGSTADPSDPGGFRGARGKAPSDRWVRMSRIDRQKAQEDVRTLVDPRP